MTGTWTNKPTPIVEFAPCNTTGGTPFGPLNIPAAGDWDALTISGRTRLLSFSNQRGRSDAIDVYDAGVATFVLDNQDGALDDAGTGTLIEGSKGTGLTPIRFRMTNAYTATTSIIWSGYITHGWQSSGPGERVRTVTVRAADWLGVASNILLPDSAIASWIADSAPQVWWRGDLTLPKITLANGGAAVDRGNISGTIGGKPGTPISADYATMTDPLAPGSDENPAMRWQIGCRLVTAATIPVPASAWSFACVFQVVDTATFGRDIAVGRTGSTAGAVRWKVRIGTNGHLQAEMFTAASVSTGTATIAIPHNDGKPHFVIVRFKPGTPAIDLESDLGFNIGGVIGTPAGGGGFIVTGNAATDVRVLVDEWAYFDGAKTWPGDYLINVIEGDSDVGMWTTDTIPARLERLAGWISFTYPANFFRPNAVAGASTVGGYLPQPNFAAAVKSTVDSLAGSAFTKRDGYVQAYGYGDLANAWFESRPVTFSNREAATTPVRYVSTGRTGKLNDRIINRVTANGAVLATDATSITRYGLQVMELDAFAGANAAGYASSIVSNRSTPSWEFTELVIQPWGDQVATTWLLEKCDLGRVVDFEQYLPDGAASPAIVDMAEVLSEAWDWSDGTDWTVTLKVSGRLGGLSL